MKKHLLLGTGILLSLFPATMQAQHDFMNHLYDYIENTSVFELNQEEGRAYYIPTQSQKLNGQWKFFYADKPEGIPAGFFAPNFSDGKWPLIEVPSNWEMRGFGDPLFRNVTAPFKADPPKVPREYNPTGAYRTTFTVPQDWQGEEVFLRFEKVASASFLWVNGQEVGYNEGAQEPAEYNITPYLKKGKNTLAMLVLKYSDGYYLEGQDYWRLAGIFDDVYVYAAPKTRLFDWYVTTDLDSQYRDATLKITATARRYEGATQLKDLSVKAQVLDAEGRQVASLSSAAGSFQGSDPTLDLKLEKLISNPLKWTSETPNLYTLKMQLCDASGKVLDEARQDLGFKETEMIDNVFYLNGKKLKVNAECSHMQDPDNGHRVTDELIQKDMTILKQFGFNGVRTSHYPPTPHYLQYANRYGLYIIDETGDEAHATEFVSYDPKFTDMYRERVRRMVLRDRNQPSVLFWSAGNESGEGPNITEVVKEGKKYDQTRWWMYGGNSYSHPGEDIIGPRYPTPAAMDLKVGLHGDGDVRPSFMDEYISVAGNGGGFFDEMWQSIYSHDRIIGGAVWDFVSTGLTETARQLTDLSPKNSMAHLMGRARLPQVSLSKQDKKNHVLDLNGHDQWVEVYRSEPLEIHGQALTISFDVFPRELISSCGSFVTKGNYQFGVQQDGKEKLNFYINTDTAPASAAPKVDPSNPYAAIIAAMSKPKNYKYTITGTLPADWEQHWHHVTAQYDGQQMTLSIDGQQVAQGEAAGNIINAPFPVNIGRNEEAHGQETSVYICDAQMDNVAIYDQAVAADGQQPENAVLYLDFEGEKAGSKYFSYGIGARTYGTIWPDRTVQPEIWQMKKSTQPVSVRMLSVDDQLVEVWNRNHFLNTNHYTHTWALFEDGKAIQSGDIDLSVEPLSRQTVRIPFTKPEVKPGKEYRLLISSRLAADELWARAGFEVSWDQLELPWKEQTVTSDKATGSVHLEQTADAIKVSGAGFTYTFDKNGTLTSMVQNGQELLKAPLQLNVWRAPIANEVDSWDQNGVTYTQKMDWNGSQVASEFYGNDLDKVTHMPISCRAYEAGGQVYLDVRTFSQFGPVHLGALDAYIFGSSYKGMTETYNYRINGDGTITLHHIASPEGKMPSLLPRIGLTFTLDPAFQKIGWYGRGPEENYPDRKTGYRIGIYEKDIEEMYEPYLIPQDHGLRCDNRWVTFRNADGNGIQVSMDQLFNFNAYPFSTDNLTKAVYQYQLQKQNGITVNLDYATTGLGCTADYVLPGYQVKAEKFERTLTIKPLK